MHDAHVDHHGNKRWDLMAVQQLGVRRYFDVGIPPARRLRRGRVRGTKSDDSTREPFHKAHILGPEDISNYRNLQKNYSPEPSFDYGCVQLEPLAPALFGRGSQTLGDFTWPSSVPVSEGELSLEGWKSGSGLGIVLLFFRFPIPSHPFFQSSTLPFAEFP
jgi:hypothetical protein